MNHTGTEVAEKKKKRQPYLGRCLRVLAISVLIFLVVSLPLAAIRFYSNLQQYNHNRRLWDEANYGEVLFLYMDGEGSGRYFGWHLMGHYASAEGLWSIASDCLYQVFCKIEYHEQYYYPEYIEPYLGEWRAKAHRFLICSEEENADFCEAFMPLDQ
jgi:hypothetical protein